MKTARLLVLGVPLLLVGCVRPYSVDGFMNPDNGGVKRAAFELGCSESQLHVVELAPATIGVTGCERRAVYKWVYGAGWVNNTGAEEHHQ